ncbi:TonB-dependent receptor domain-containing protein, partial [Chryseobacterium sp. SIMBA_038]|uniref:TonB-dependent receptor domain-containing protein n=1 Tax=Chryseobacterium sp. SIMBA_038 TaxID=3085780 RepID=UPI003979204A
PGSTGEGLIVPGLYAIRNSAGQVFPTQEYSATFTLPRAYGQISLGYQDTYFLEGTGSVDKSSNLPSGNNVYFYPSISGSVVLSNLIKQDWLSFLKVRGNWAQVGKTIDNYRLADTYNIRSLYGNLPIVDPNSFKNNPNLKPERSTEVEVGLEAKFLN